MIWPLRWRARQARRAEAPLRRVVRGRGHRDDEDEAEGAAHEAAHPGRACSARHARGAGSRRRARAAPSRRRGRSPAASRAAPGTGGRARAERSTRSGRRAGRGGRRPAPCGAWRRASRGSPCRGGRGWRRRRRATRRAPTRSRAAVDSPRRARPGWARTSRVSCTQGPPRNPGTVGIASATIPIKQADPICSSADVVRPPAARPEDRDPTGSEPSRPRVARGARARASRPDGAGPVGASPSAVLTFKDRSQPARSISLEALEKACPELEVEVDDPYYGRRMRYRALSFRCVLDQGFAARGGAASLAPGEPSLEGAGWVHAAGGGRGRRRSERPSRLRRIGTRRAPLPPDRPAPGRSRALLSRLDRSRSTAIPMNTRGPISSRRSRSRPSKPHSRTPRPGASRSSDAGWRGYALFQESCSACHAINGEGGTVGPELNVPRSIVEYRPLAQIRAYIRNPEATRYTSMPAHPQLSDADLDALIAYFTRHERAQARPARGSRIVSGSPRAAAAQRHAAARRTPTRDRSRPLRAAPVSRSRRRSHGDGAGLR